MLSTWPREIIIRSYQASAVPDHRRTSNLKATYASFAERIERSEMPPYVYTYPPKGTYHPFRDGQRVVESWKSVTGPVALYVHVPFCDMKCHFCNLFQTTQHSFDIRIAYVAALQRELEMVLASVDGDSLEVHSVYFGGGTPTTLSTTQLDELLNSIARRLPIRSDAEISIESTPNATDGSTLSELLHVGFNRISYGIQTFDETELRAVGRLYGANHGYAEVERAIACGFSNVNIDLIYGLPDQTEDRWLHNLALATRLEPPTITLYPLVVRRRTVYGRQHDRQLLVPPTDSLKYRYYDAAVDMLTKCGYRQHTFVTFGRGTGGNRHEANEFRGLPTLALGAGARSYAPTCHYSSDDYITPRAPSAIINTYLGCIADSSIPVISGVELDDDDVVRRYVILSLLHEGIALVDYARRFREPLLQRFAPEMRVLEMSGCIDLHHDTIKLTRLGRRFSSLVAEFLTSEGVRIRRTAYG